MIKFSKAESSETLEIATVLSTNLSERSESGILNLINEQVVVIAKDNQRIVGATTGEIISKQKSVFPIGQEHLLDKYNLTKPLGIMQSSSVLTKYRR